MILRTAIRLINWSPVNQLPNQTYIGRVYEEEQHIDAVAKKVDRINVVFNAIGFDSRQGTPLLELALTHSRTGSA